MLPTVAELVPYGYFVWLMAEYAFAVLCFFCLIVDLRIDAKTIVGKCGAISLFGLGMASFSHASYLLWWSVWRLKSYPSWMVDHWILLIFIFVGTISMFLLMFSITMPYVLGLVEKENERASL